MLRTTCLQKDSEKSWAFPDSSSASTELKRDSDAVLAIELDSNVADEKCCLEISLNRCGRSLESDGSCLLFPFFPRHFLMPWTIRSLPTFSLNSGPSGQTQKLPWLPIAFLGACIATSMIWYVDGEIPVCPFDQVLGK